jgi:hypothetical protein
MFSRLGIKSYIFKVVLSFFLNEYLNFSFIWEQRISTDDELTSNLPPSNNGWNLCHPVVLIHCPRLTFAGLMFVHDIPTRRLNFTDTHGPREDTTVPAPYLQANDNRGYLFTSFFLSWHVLGNENQKEVVNYCRECNLHNDRDLPIEYRIR